MLTIVFSTRRENPAFIDHLRQTCGLEAPEILQYVNNGQYSLTEIYNRGLREAAHDIVVFSHDDIILDPADRWGEKILQHFRDSDFGILGKAGTTSLARSAKWWDQPDLMIGQVGHKVADPQTGGTMQWLNTYSGIFGGEIIETILVDGLFFAVHRKRIKKLFDEDIKGFHFYDIDFSFANHLSGVKVGVIFDMQITHKSVGITNEQWESNKNFFVRKWESHLPHSIKPEIRYEQFTIAIPHEPKLAVIIPIRHTAPLLFDCIAGIKEKSKYHAVKIYMACAALKGEDADRIREFAGSGHDMKLIEYPEYHLPHMVNDVVKNHLDPDTELLLICKQTIRLLNDAISRCVQVYLENRQEIGTAGIRLHSEDNTIQHAGIRIYFDRKNTMRIKPEGFRSYYAYHPGIQRDTLGNTGEFMMVDKNLFLLLGGFSTNYTEYLEDVEFSLKALIAGRVNYFIGDAVGVNLDLESDSEDPETVKRQFQDYQTLMNFIHENSNKPRLTSHIKKLNR